MRKAVSKLTKGKPLLYREMTLTANNLQHVRMSRAWTGSFRRITKKHHVPRWRFDLWTINMLKVIKARDEEGMAEYCRRREGVLFSAISHRCKKRVSLIYSPQGFDKTFAHTSCWDPDYGNYPDLTFLTQDDSESFVEFEELFARFIQANSQQEILSFERYVRRKYRNKYKED